MASISDTTSFRRKHLRSPNIKQDGIVEWLKDQIEWLEETDLTEFGHGSLATYRRVLKEIECE